MHKFSPSSVERLDTEERRKKLPPAETLRRFGLKEGMTLVDIGAGSGYFSRAASEIIGLKGEIFATDISKEMLHHLESQGIPENITTVLSKEYEVPLANAIANFVLIAFVAHETPDLKRFLKEAVRLTKKQGRIAIIDWIKQEEEHGPPKKERLSEELLDRTLNEYNVVKKGRLNESHYFRIIQNT